MKLRLSKIFNLNDPGWGRGGGSNDQEPRGSDERPPSRPHRRPPNNQGGNPPDLDQVIADLSKRLKSVFGGKGGGGGNNRDPFNQNNNTPRRQGPSPRFAKFGIIFVIIGALLLWLASGFFIVREGQVGIVTQFGKYNRTVSPGFQWHVPSPIESVELVDISRVRSFSVGYRDSARNKVLPEALKLTEDENIVDVQFDVQYRLKADMNLEQGRHSAAADYLFQTVSPDEAVRQAAETAMREVVGKQSMNRILYESRTQAAIDVRILMQQILDRYRTGIDVITVAIQNVQPPEQVQAAFEDAIKAGQDNERQKNEGHAYASKVIPEARGQAQRIVQDAEGYKARVIGEAQGGAERFTSVEREYSQAPAITRERMYISTIEDVYANASKVMIDTAGGNNMIYLPVDKLIEQSSSAVNRSNTYTPPTTTNSSNTTSNTSASGSASTSNATGELSRDRNAFPRTRPGQ